MNRQRSSALRLSVAYRDHGWLLALAVFLVGGHAGNAQDLRAFDSEESYVVEGRSIVLM